MADDLRMALQDLLRKSELGDPAFLREGVRVLAQVSGLGVPAVEQRQPDGTMITLQAAQPGPPFLVLGWDDSYVR